MTEFPEKPTPAWWLVRLPEVFAEFAAEITPGSTAKDGEGEYRRVAANGHAFPLPDESAMFCRWRMPVHHAWPCDPEKTEGFIEKAATALRTKFSDRQPRAVLIAAVDPRARNGYFRKLASNLRGRALQLMPDANASVEQLAGDDTVLYALVGRTGLYCGLQSPREANGFHPGGTRFFQPEVSRAGAKIASALHHLRLLMPPLLENPHWLELGASPGGMTSELLRHGHRVTAIDRAALDPSLDGAPGLRFHRADVATWKPADGTAFDALLCDMNGPADAAFAQVARLARHLKPGAPVIFTLKTTGAEGFAEILALHRRILTNSASLTHLQTTHLAYNRREFTVFLVKAPRDPIASQIPPRPQQLHHGRDRSSGRSGE